MDLKLAYSRGKEAFNLIMVGIDFYKKHEEEINSIVTKVKEYFGAVKKDWDQHWNGFDPVEPVNLIKGININYNDVVEWIDNKSVVTTKEVGDTFKVNPIEALLVLRQLENNHLVKKALNKIGTFSVIKKGVDA